MKTLGIKRFVDDSKHTQVGADKVAVRKVSARGMHQINGHQGVGSSRGLLLFINPRFSHPYPMLRSRNGSIGPRNI